MTRSLHFLLLLVLLFIPLFLVSCEGGDGSSDSGESPPGDSDGSDEDDDDPGLSPGQAPDDDDDPGSSPGQAPDDDDDDDNDDDVTPLDQWTDPDTGLSWLYDVPARMKWSAAKAYCESLPPHEGQSWRMPTISELRSLIRGCPYSQTGGPCGISDQCLSGTCHNWYCNGCSFGGGPAGGCYCPNELEGPCTWYWSSSLVAEYDSDVWGIFFGYGFINSYSMDDRYLVRCVRP